MLGIYSSLLSSKLSVAGIPQLARTDKKDTNALGIVKVAEQLGFSAKGVRGELAVLPQAPITSIAHVVLY